MYVGADVAIKSWPTKLDKSCIHSLISLTASIDKLLIFKVILILHLGLGINLSKLLKMSLPRLLLNQDYYVFVT